jgi:hypothetical protein
MAKTRRNYRKSRKTKKQKGGEKQYFAKGIRQTDKTFTLPIEEGNTARKVLKKLIATNSTIKNNWANTTMLVLPYRMRLKGKEYPMLKNTKWDNEELFKNVNHETSIQFIPVLERLNSFKQKKKTEAEETFEIVKKALNFFGGGKIITESAATTDSIKKNVMQQFKFFKEPFQPIILIDWAFFRSPYDFYHLLNFDEVNVETLGPRDKIRLYVKPENRPLRAKDPTNAYHQEYVKEVYKQADAKDLIKEIKIMCISHDLNFENSRTDLSIKNYIETHFSPNQFQLYTWADESKL